MNNQLKSILTDIAKSSTLSFRKNESVDSQEFLVTTTNSIIDTTNQLLTLESLREATAEFAQEKHENTLQAKKESAIESLDVNSSTASLPMMSGLQEITDLLNTLKESLGKLEDFGSSGGVDIDIGRRRRFVGSRRGRLRPRIDPPARPVSPPIVTRPSSRAAGIAFGVAGAAAVAAPTLALSTTTNNTFFNMVNSASQITGMQGNSDVNTHSGPSISSSSSAPAPMAGGAVPGDYAVAGRMGVSPQEWDIYRNTIAYIESGGRYDIIGGAGNLYDGRYQMYGPAKQDGARHAGVSVPSSREEFRRNPSLQETLFAGFTLGNSKVLERNEKFKGMSPRERLVILGYAHNQGAGAALRWLRTGVAGRDGFGTLATKYSDALTANLFGGSQPSSSMSASATSAVPSGDSIRTSSNGMVLPPTGGNDLARLAGVNPALQNVVRRAYQMDPCFRVAEGLRTIERQREVFRQGFSRTMNSFHLTGHAVDLYPKNWSGRNNDLAGFRYVASLMMRAARELNVRVTSGGLSWGWDWPHFQIPRPPGAQPVTAPVSPQSAIMASQPSMPNINPSPMYDANPILSILFPGLMADNQAAPSERVSGASQTRENQEKSFSSIARQESIGRTISPQISNVMRSRNEKASPVPKKQSSLDQYKTYFRVG